MKILASKDGRDLLFRCLRAFFTPIVFGWGTLFLLWLFLGR